MQGCLDAPPHLQPTGSCVAAYTVPDSSRKRGMLCALCNLYMLPVQFTTIVCLYPTVMLLQ